MSTNVQLWVFFSLENNEKIPITHLKESLFLCSTGIIKHKNFRLLSALEHPKLVEKYKIPFFPYYIIKKGAKFKGYKSILQAIGSSINFEDALSKSSLYALSFRKGRSDGKRFHKIDAKKKDLQKKLGEVLLNENVSRLNVFGYSKKSIKVSIISKDLKKKDSYHKLLLKGYLGGLFTEISGKGVSFNQIKHDTKRGEYLLEAHRHE